MSISKTPSAVASKQIQPTTGQPQATTKGNQSSEKQAIKPPDKTQAKPVQAPQKTSIAPSKPTKTYQPEVFLDDDSDEDNDIKCDRCMQSFWFKKELVTHLIDVHKMSEEEQEKERQKKAAALREEIRKKALAKQMEERQRMAQKKMEEQRRVAITNQKQLHQALARANEAARLRNEQRLVQERNSIAKRRELQTLQDRNARAKRLELQMLIERRNRLMSKSTNDRLITRDALTTRSSSRDANDNNREIRLGSGIVIQRSELPTRVTADSNTVFKFHYDNENRFVCQLCTRKFNDANSMVLHWKSHVILTGGRGDSASRLAGRLKPAAKKKGETITLDSDSDVQEESEDDSRKTNDRSSTRTRLRPKRNAKYDWNNNEKETKQKNDRERRAEERTKKKSESKYKQWTPHLMWSTRFRKKLMTEFPEWTFSEIGKATSEGWKNVSEREVQRLEEEVFCVNERNKCREEKTEYWTPYKLWAKRMKSEMLEEHPTWTDYAIQKACEKDWKEVKKEYKDILEDQVTVINRHNLSSKKGKPICNAFLLWSIETMQNIQKKESSTTEVAIGKAITEGWQEVEEEKLDALVAESVRLNQKLTKSSDDDSKEKSKRKDDDDEKEDEEEEEIGDDEDWDPFVVQLKKVQDIIDDIEGKGEKRKKRKVSFKTASSTNDDEEKISGNILEPQVEIHSDNEKEEEADILSEIKDKQLENEKMETLVSEDDDEIMAEKENIKEALTKSKSFLSDLNEPTIGSGDNSKDDTENSDVTNYTQEEIDKILDKNIDSSQNQEENTNNSKKIQNKDQEDKNNNTVEEMDLAEKDIEQYLEEEELTTALENENETSSQNKEGIFDKEASPALSKATIESAERLGLSYKDLFSY